MKRAQQYLNEKLSVSGKVKEYSPGILGQMEQALPDLEEEIYNILGPESRTVELGLIVKHNQIRDTYEIMSDNLVDLTGPIGKYTYDEFRFETWGGKQTNDDKPTIWFNPKFSFHYINGGSNGADALWTGFYFDYENDTWIFGKRYN